MHSENRRTLAALGNLVQNYFYISYILYCNMIYCSWEVQLKGVSSMGSVFHINRKGNDILRRKYEDESVKQ